MKQDDYAKKALQDPKKWRVLLDKRAEQKRNDREKKAREDPTAWREHLDKKAARERARVKKSDSA